MDILRYLINGVQNPVDTHTHQTRIPFGLDVDITGPGLDGVCDDVVDQLDDRRIGIKSTAILFGRYDRAVIGLLQLLMLLLLGLVAHLAALGAVLFGLRLFDVVQDPDDATGATSMTFVDYTLASASEFNSIPKARVIALDAELEDMIVVDGDPAAPLAPEARLLFAFETVAEPSSTGRSAWGHSTSAAPTSPSPR